MAADHISEGDARSLRSLSQRYAVRSVLGRGAFAAVYLADDLEKDRPVVIKLLGAADSHSDSAILRFHAEVAASRLLQHRNIVRVLDDGATSDHRPYLITEYIPGRSLAAVLKESGRLPIHRAVDVGIGIARALTYVHGQKYVHRDIKPSNILIPGWPDRPDYKNPKLLDFGVVGRLEQGRTQAGMIFGTLRYMSPEQIKGERQSAATDVYGFGLLLFEMLRGAAPSNRERDLTTLLIAIRDGIPEKDLEGVPSELADLIQRCARAEPGERPTMAAVLKELENSPHLRADPAFEGPVEVRPDLTVTGAAPAIPPPSPRPAPPPSPAAQQITQSTLAVEAGRPQRRQRTRTGPEAPLEGSPRGFGRIAVAAAVAIAAVALILFLHPVKPSAPDNRQPSISAPDSTVPMPGKTSSQPSVQAPAQPPPSSAAPSRLSATTIDRLRILAGLLLIAASLAIGFWLRTWLGSRSQVRSQAYDLVFGARARNDLTATIALQLDELVSSLRNLDERILAGSVALMLNEYGSATDAKDRQAALMNVVALSEKLAVRLSPWYERHKEVIASAVAVMGSLSGLATALNSIFKH